MSMLLDTVKPIGASRAQVDAWVDILDRSEPDQSNWRTPFNALQEQLSRARRIRRTVRVPLVVLFMAGIVARRIVSEGPAMPTWSWWVSTVGLLALGALVVSEFAIRRLFPVLELEGRVAALLRYYGDTDVSLAEDL